MTHAPLPATRKSYWHTSRSPRYSLTFALPLLALYEVGLPIARQIAAAHRGTIEIARANGRGTVVRVTLPLAGGARSTHVR